MEGDVDMNNDEKDLEKVNQENQENKANSNDYIDNQEHSKPEDDLDALMKQATGGSETKDEVFESPTKKKPSKKIIVPAILGSVLFVGALVGGAFMLNKDEFVDKTDNPEWVGKEKEEVQSEIVRKFPIEVNSWAKEPYSAKSFWNEKTEKEVLKAAEDNYSIYQSTAWIPSAVGGFLEGEDPGYTNDPKKSTLKNGEENPYYSYALAEDYRKAYIVYTERFINPLFGAWGMWERADENRKSTSFENLEDIFAVEWWEKNLKNDKNGYKKLPILIEQKAGDWDKFNLLEATEDNYLDVSQIFFGKINETPSQTITVETIGTDPKQMPIIKTKTPILYSAFNNNGKNVEIKADLEMTMRSSQSRVDINNRIEVIDAKLTIKE